MQDQLNSYNQGYATGLNNLQNKQQGETADYLGRYTNAVNSLPNEQQLFNQLGASQNLPQLHDFASKANIAVNNIPRDELTYAQQNGGGGNLDQNQLNQLIQQKLYDLSPIAQKATQQYQDALQTVQQQMQYAIDQQNRSLLPFQAEGSLLGDRLAREMTGFTAQQQAALDGLTAKYNTQGSLSQAEMAQMTELARQENDFHNQQALQAQAASLGLGRDIASQNHQLTAQGYSLGGGAGSFARSQSQNTGGGGGGMPGNGNLNSPDFHVPDSFLPGQPYQLRAAKYSAMWQAGGGQ